MRRLIDRAMGGDKPQADGEPKTFPHLIRQRYWRRIAYHAKKIMGFTATSLIICCSLAITFCQGSSAQSAGGQTAKLFDNDVPQGATAVAQKRLMPFLKAIPDQYLQRYNFKSRQETANARIGAPYQLYTIHPDKIIHYDGKSSIVDMVSPTGEWYFPVMVHNEIRTTFMVALMEGKWEAVDLGGNLANTWDTVLKKWPPSKGYRHVFVRVFQAAADFAVTSKSGKITIMPLESAARSLGMERGQAIETSVMVTRLKQPVLDNINSFNKSKRGLVK